MSTVALGTTLLVAASTKQSKKMKKRSIRGRWSITISSIDARIQETRLVFVGLRAACSHVASCLAHEFSLSILTKILRLFKIQSAAWLLYGLVPSVLLVLLPGGRAPGFQFDWVRITLSNAAIAEAPDTDQGPTTRCWQGLLYHTPRLCLEKKLEMATGFIFTLFSVTTLRFFPLSFSLFLQFSCLAVSSVSFFWHVYLAVCCSAAYSFFASGVQDHSSLKFYLHLPFCLYSQQLFIILSGFPLFIIF